MSEVPALDSTVDTPIYEEVKVVTEIDPGKQMVDTDPPVLEFPESSHNTDEEEDDEDEDEDWREDEDDEDDDEEEDDEDN